MLLIVQSHFQSGQGNVPYCYTMLYVCTAFIFGTRAHLVFVPNGAYKGVGALVQDFQVVGT